MKNSLRTSAVLLLLTPTLVGCGRVGLFARFFAMGFESFVQETVPVAKKLKDPKRADARLVVTWVGHATVLVQMDDKFILTDPVFTRTVGNLSARLIGPGLDVTALPPLDAIVVSHLHFDHLSLGSLDLLEGRYESLVLPPGGAVYVPSATIPPRELSTWETAEFDGLRITAVPVEHVGFRYGGDLSWSTEGYTGYVIEYRDLKVFFGGDTAKSPWMFHATGRRFPGLDLAILPIAPIHPREFMEHTHVDPAEALDAFRDLRAKKMMAMHFDTFVNSLDEFGEAPAKLRALLPERGLDEESVVILRQGQQRVVR